MSRLFIGIALCLVSIGTSTVFAQVGSDFFFQLQPGYQWVYRSDNTASGWADRTIIESIIGTESVQSQEYSKLRGVEVLDANQSDSVIFHCFWVRKDTDGGVVMGAVSDGYTVLDSATQFDPAAPMFPNVFLTAGFSFTQYYAGGHYTLKDSTTSTSASVDVPAGTFNNCLEMLEEHRDSLGNVIFSETHYYASGVGEVMTVRTVPANAAHINRLVSCNVVTGVEEAGTVTRPAGFALCQNYPNPFNPSTTISFNLPFSSEVSLKIFDLLGREVTVLASGHMAAGMHSVRWNASGVQTGVYFYRFEANGRKETRKLCLIR